MIYDRPLIQRLYNRSPVLIQHLIVSAYGVLKRRERLTPTYRRYRQELERTQWLDRGQLEALQTERLRALIQHCFENVPYYRRLFDDLKLRPADFRTAEDLYKLPVLTKHDVRNHQDQLRARNIPRSRVTTGRTGGTTGIPLAFALDKDRVVFDHALIDRHWSWAGFEPLDRVVLLRGFTIVPPETPSGIYWRHDWADRRIYLSGFHLGLGSMPVYLQKLREWSPKLIAGYPSSIFTLARFMEREGVEIPVQGIFTSSEVLTPTERRVIERRFRCRVWDRYGTGERLVVSQQCEHGSYHLNSEFGILQVDKVRGEPAPIGEKGELIQTALTNYSMPFIRYASEDVGYLIEGSCACGRGLPLSGPVDGRKDDVIVAADGRLMPRAGLDQIHEFVENIERCQLVQEQVGELTVRVLPRPGFGDADSEELIDQLQRRVGSDTDIQVEIVDALPLTAQGKERFIVSSVDVDGITGLGLGLDRLDSAGSRS